MSLELEKVRLHENGEESLDASATGTIRLVNAGGPQLIQARLADQGLELIPARLAPARAPSRLFARPGAKQVIPQVQFMEVGTPPLDVTMDGDGAASATWSISGSAVALLEFRSTRALKSVRASGSSFGVYGGPAFARSTGHPHDIVARRIEENDSYTIIVFREDDTGHFQRKAAIRVPWGNRELDDLRLVGLGEAGYLLLVNSHERGDFSPEIAKRKTYIEPDKAAGILEAVSLDREFRPIGPRTRPFGDVPVYEVDADRAGANVAIFATTPEGALFTVCDASGRPVPTAPAEAVQEQSPESATKTPPRTSPPAWRFPLAIPSAAPLVSPSIVQVGTELYVAALRDLGRPTARILAGRVDVNALNALLPSSAPPVTTPPPAK